MILYDTEIKQIIRVDRSKCQAIKSHSIQHVHFVIALLFRKKI